MSKTDPKNITILLGVGDLIVNVESQTIGVLLEKHRLLRTSVRRESKNVWEWAWSIKWSSEPQKATKANSSWVKFHACSEQSIINEIKRGLVEHYSVK